MNKYGTCKCGSALEPIWFTEEETEIVHGCICKTGRKRRAVDVLVCPTCFKEYATDDSFDGPWQNS